MKIKDICLNFNENYIMFYDWLKSDNLQKYHNLIIKRISTKDINDIIKYDIELNTSLEKPIILTDTFSFIALKEENNKVLISSLLLKDEEKLKNKVEKLKEETLKYIKKQMRKENTELRYLYNIRTKIKEEILSLKKTDSLDKLAYLYYEWFHKKEDNIEFIATKMLNKCSGPVTSEEKYIYDLIVASKKLV